VTATISLVAGSESEGMLAAAARLASSIASLQARTAAPREALAQLVSGWRGDAARTAMVRAERNLRRQHQLLVRLHA